jgi:hypothetical protein
MSVIGAGFLLALAGRGETAWVSAGDSVEPFPPPKTVNATEAVVFKNVAA